MSNQLKKFRSGNDDQRDGQKDGKSPSRDGLKQLNGEYNKPPFLLQLQTMLDHETNNNSDAIQWLETGDGFVITDQNKLVKEIIPKFFPKPVIFQSFVRKLYKFSFRQIDSSNKGRYEFVSKNNDFNRKTHKPIIRVDSKIDDAVRSKSSIFLNTEEKNNDASSDSDWAVLLEAQHTESGITNTFLNTSKSITRSHQTHSNPQNVSHPQLQSFLYPDSIKNTQLSMKLHDSIGTDGKPSQIEAEKSVLKTLLHSQSQQRRQTQEEGGLAPLIASNATASEGSSNFVRSMQTNNSRNPGHEHQNNLASSCMMRKEIEKEFIRFESIMSHRLKSYNPNKQHITDLFLALRQQQQEQTAVSQENSIFEHCFYQYQKVLALLLQQQQQQQQLDTPIGRRSGTGSEKFGLPSLALASATDAAFSTGSSAVPFNNTGLQQLQILGTENKNGNSHVERVVNFDDNRTNSNVLQNNIPVHLLSNIYQNILSSKTQAKHHESTRTRMLPQPPGGEGVERLFYHQMQQLNAHENDDQRHGRVWAMGPSSLEEMLNLTHRHQGQSQTGSMIFRSQDRPSRMIFFENCQLLQNVLNQQGQQNYTSLPSGSALATATSLDPSESTTAIFHAARSPCRGRSEMILNNAKSCDSQRASDHHGRESGWEHVLSDLIRQKMAQNQEFGAQGPSCNQLRSGSGSGSGLSKPGWSQQQQNPKNVWHENSRDTASSSFPIPGFSIIDYLTRDYVRCSSGCQSIDNATESQDQDRKPASDQEKDRDPSKIQKQPELFRGLSRRSNDANSNFGLLSMQRKGVVSDDHEGNVNSSSAVEAPTAIAAAASSTSLTRHQLEVARIDAYHSYLRMKLNENGDAESNLKYDRGVENDESEEIVEESEWGSGKKSKKRKF